MTSLTPADVDRLALVALRNWHRGGDGGYELDWYGPEVRDKYRALVVALAEVWPESVRFPAGWERGHEAKYWLQTGLTPYGLTLDPERAPGVLNWIGVNYFTPDSPHLPPTRAPEPAAPVALPTVDEVARTIERKMYAFSDDIDIAPDSNAIATARAVLDLIAARLPVWQPVEPGTVIKAGTLTRIEWADRDAREEVTRCDFKVDPTDPGGFYIDPRTVPAEPEDPAIVEVIDWWRGSIEPMATDKAAARDLLARIDAARAAR